MATKTKWSLPDPVTQARIWTGWLETLGWRFDLDSDGQVVCVAPDDPGCREGAVRIGVAGFDAEIRAILEARARGVDATVGERPAPQPTPTPRHYKNLAKLLGAGPVTDVVHRPGWGGGWWTVRVAGDVVELGTGRRLNAEQPRLLAELWRAAGGGRR